MPITQIPKFRTHDGTTFDTLEEAQAYETRLEIDSKLDGIAQELEIPERTVATLKRWVPVIISKLDYVPAETFDEESDGEVASATDEQADAA